MHTSIKCVHRLTMHIDGTQLPSPPTLLTITTTTVLVVAAANILNIIVVAAVPESYLFRKFPVNCELK